MSWDPDAKTFTLKMRSGPIKMVRINPQELNPSYWDNYQRAWIHDTNPPLLNDGGCWKDTWEAHKALKWKQADRMTIWVPEAFALQPEPAANEWGEVCP